MKNLTIIGLTPFEQPDLDLMHKLDQADAFPVLSLKDDLTSAQAILDMLSQTNISSCGIYFPNDKFRQLQFPKNVRIVTIPYSTAVNQSFDLPIIYQIATLEEAKGAGKIGGKWESL